MTKLSGLQHRGSEERSATPALMAFRSELRIMDVHTDSRRFGWTENVTRANNHVVIMYDLGGDCYCFQGRPVQSHSTERVRRDGERVHARHLVPERFRKESNSKGR